MSSRTHVSVKSKTKPASRPGHSAFAEPLEARRHLSVVRPDHVVVVIEQDRASDAIGNSNFPYLNSLASTGLYYSNSHGVTHPSEPNTLALYSGSTQGVTDNGRNYSFSGPNLAKSLFDAGLSFSGYVENLPADGSQVTQAGDGQYPDLYTRNLNAMAQFTDAGLLPGGARRPNSAVNRTFGAFQSIPTGDYSSLPTVSFVIPNNLHNAHGSNEAYPWAGSPDEQNNDILRRSADAWLRDQIDPYLQWAKNNNSLLIVTQDEERWTGGTAQTVTTLVNGDPDLFVPGTNSSYVNHYNVLRTIEEMYGLPLLGNTAAAAPLATDSLGRLAPTAAPTVVATSTSLASSANPSQAGQSVTFTATVSAASGSVIPTGTVTFRIGASVLGTAAVGSTGVATFSTSTLAAGSHSITAAYGGDARFSASTSPALTQTVNPAALAATTTSLASSANPSVAGQAVTFTATVASGAGMPGGTVTFRNGSSVLGTAALDASGRAVFTTSGLAAGSHSITAAYGGNATFAASTSPALTQTVNPAAVAATTTTLASSLNPSVSGQAVTFSATVAAASGASGTPSGTVTFRNGSAVIGTSTLDASGRAILRTSSLAVGSHSITASYGGDARFGASTSAALAQRVNSTTSAPANDLFANRLGLQGASAKTSGTNSRATRETGEPRHAGNAGGKSVWWTWTAPATGPVTIDTIGSTFDTLLAVYTGTSVSALTLVAANDDTGASGVVTSKVTFTAAAGRQYQIAIDGYGGSSGSITLRVNQPTLTTATTTSSTTLFSTRRISPRRVAEDSLLV